MCKKIIFKLFTIRGVETFKVKLTSIIFCIAAIVATLTISAEEHPLDKS